MSRAKPIAVLRERTGPAAGWADQNANDERESVVEIEFGADYVVHVVVRHVDHPTKSREECQRLAEIRASQFAERMRASA
jgi:hypothetical protein